MKKTEAIETLDMLGAMTEKVSCDITLTNRKTGAEYRLDAKTTLAIVEGTLGYCIRLLEHDSAKKLSDREQFEELIKQVSVSVAYSLEDDEAE